MAPNDLFGRTAGPSPGRPLAGLTVLLVEDSRFASEALRLMCLRSGARIRRADSLAHARRHLMVYRPSCIVVDLGMPDGSGTDLIARLAAAEPRIGVILGLSGDPEGEARALQAGADGFLAKPVLSLARFQQAILSALPAAQRPLMPGEAPEVAFLPDPVAYRDDLRHAAGMLAGPAGPGLAYVTQFLAGVARSAGDRALSRAVDDLARHQREGRAPGPAQRHLHDMVSARLAQAGPL